MLFMGGQQHPNLDNLSDKYRDDESRETHGTQSNLRNIGLSITGFYILVSIISVIFYPPISLVSLIFPAITLILTLCASRFDNKDSFWPCILMASLGLLLKLVACIIFISIFGFPSQEKPSNPQPVFSKNKTPSVSSDMRAIFFGILTSVEFFFLILACCVQWHLIAFKKCMED
ncbi:hypothetical protein FO519_005877 [Halicephalobus sp. NKZ332]|nr:hypothetical protein FO519_005877 [Halicephalobus sp. NKZ332]